MGNTINHDDLNNLSEDFQYRLLYHILAEEKFGSSIIEIIEPNYFSGSYLRTIVGEIKNAYEKYETIPDLGSIRIRMSEKAKTDVILNMYNQIIDKIQNANLNDSLYVKDLGLKFCKKQELKKALRECENIINESDLTSYEKCETIIKKALEKGDVSSNTINVLHNISSVLDDDFRKPIPTGISGLDKIMGGGLAKGELGVILAAFGVGKTTMFTKLANTAFNEGYKVLQIFFEDTLKVIQRKHLACWTGINLFDFKENKEDLQEFIDNFDNNFDDDSNLRLMKMDSTETTMTTIKAEVRKLISRGFKPDIILIDYIDCVKPSHKVDDVNVGEGMVMREFESMLSEFEIAGWTAVQGGRCCSLDTSINIENKGVIKIGDVKLGDKILTHKGYKEVTHIFPIEKQQVYKIKTKSGKEIKVSAKHDFPISSGVLKSIRTGLSVGDKLLIKKY